MTTKSKFQAVKGVRDLLPPETALWSCVEQTAREVFATFGFGEIRLPIFEPTELFARAVGGETDIVGKEMYSFEDRPAPDLERFKYILSFEPESLETPPIAAHLHDLKVALPELKAARAHGDLRNTDALSVALENLSALVADLDEHTAQRKALSDRELARKLADIRRIGRILEIADHISLRPEATASVCRAYI